MTRVNVAMLLNSADRARRQAAPPLFVGGGMGYFGGLGAKKPHVTLGTPPKAPKAPKDPKPSKDDVWEWTHYVALLVGLRDALRAGKADANSPLPSAPTGPGTKALKEQADKLITKDIPEARQRRGYVATLYAESPAGKAAAQAALDKAAADKAAQDKIDADKAADDKAKQDKIDADKIAADELAARLAAANTPGASLTTTTNVAPGSSGPAYTLPSGTVIDASTGEPIQNSLLSNKYVWIGLAIAAGLIYWKKRKR